MRTHPVFSESNSLTHIRIPQNHRRRRILYNALLQSLQRIPNALQSGSHKRPRVRHGSKPQTRQLSGRQVLCHATFDDIRQHRNVQFPDASLHRLFIRQSFDKHSISADSFKLGRPCHCFIPSMDQGISAGEDEDISPFVAGVTRGLDARVGLPARHDRFPFRVATSYPALA